MSDTVPITSGSGTSIATDDVSSVHYQRVKRSVGADGSATDFLDRATRSDTFTGTGNGTTSDVSAQGMKHFSMQVKGTGAAASSWTANLQLSLDGTNFTTYGTHSSADTPADADGAMVVISSPAPALYFRSNVSALTLGGASALVVTILGKP